MTSRLRYFTLHSFTLPAIFTYIVQLPAATDLLEDTKLRWTDEQVV